MTVLPEKLARYVDDDRLANNAANYPEIQRELTPGQELATAAIKSVLLGIPLTHASQAPAYSLRGRGIIPSAQLARVNPEHKNNTYELDRSLGLDEYSFMNWGGVEEHSFYGKTLVGINTRAILLSPHTIASPLDIMVTKTLETPSNIPYEQLTEADRNGVDKYFDSLVTGKLWLEIMARRVLEKVVRGKIKDALYIKDCDELGEIKYYGRIQRTDIVGDFSDTKGKQDAARLAYESGTALPVTTYARDYSNRTSAGAEPLMRWASPEVIGVDPSIPKEIWADIIDAANS